MICWNLEKRNVLEGPPKGLIPVNLLLSDPPVPWKTDDSKQQIIEIWTPYLSEGGIILLENSEFHLSHEEYLPWVEEKILKHSFPGDLVVDPFCGTSTTGIAAVKNGRKYYGSDVATNMLIRSQMRLRNYEKNGALDVVEAGVITDWNDVVNLDVYA